MSRWEVLSYKVAISSPILNSKSACIGLAKGTVGYLMRQNLQERQFLNLNMLNVS